MMKMKAQIQKEVHLSFEKSLCNSASSLFYSFGKQTTLFFSIAALFFIHTRTLMRCVGANCLGLFK